MKTIKPGNSRKLVLSRLTISQYYFQKEKPVNTDPKTRYICVSALGVLCQTVALQGEKLH
jgi:hypothetical protein